MRCMVEETFGPTLPVMSVGDAEEAVALANEGPYGLQASVWTRDHERGEQIARRLEAGLAMVNDAQLNYVALELPMGGWKASGLGSRHGPDGIRKYTKRQSLMVTPGLRAGARRASLPLQRAGQPDDRRDVRGAGDQRPVLGRPAGDAGGALRHVHPLARRRPTATADDRYGFWRRAASHATIPEGSRSRCCRPSCPTSRSVGLRELLDALAADGMAAATPQEAARADRPRLQRPEPRGARRDLDPARYRRDALLRAARPRHRAQPDLGARSATRARSRRPPIARASSRCTGPRAPRR